MLAVSTCCWSRDGSTPYVYVFFMVAGVAIIPTDTIIVYCLPHQELPAILATHTTTANGSVAPHAMYIRNPASSTVLAVTHQVKLRAHDLVRAVLTPLNRNLETTKTRNRTGSSLHRFTVGGAKEETRER